MSDDLSPAAAIRAFAFSAGPVAPAPSETSPAAPTTPAAPAIPVEPYPPANLSESHTAQWIEIEKENLATGKITLEEANRRFDSLGATPEQRAQDTRSAEVKLIDQLSPPAKESDFLIRYGEPGQLAPPMTPELKAFDTSVRTWLSGAEFPRDSGNSLITQIERTVRATKGMTPEQLDSYVLLENAKLERAYGDTLDAKQEAARQMVQRSKRQRQA